MNGCPGVWEQMRGIMSIYAQMNAAHIAIQLLNFPAQHMQEEKGQVNYSLSQFKSIYEFFKLGGYVLSLGFPWYPQENML